MLVFLAFAFYGWEVSLGLAVCYHLSGMRVFLLVLHFQRVLRPPFYFFFEKLFLVVFKPEFFFWIKLSGFLGSMLGQLVVVLAEDGVLNGLDLVGKQLGIFEFILLLNLHVHEDFNALLDLVNQTEPVQVHQFPLLVLEQRLVVPIDFFV